jgi:hypothetical protein
MMELLLAIHKDMKAILDENKKKQPGNPTGYARR